VYTNTGADVPRTISLEVENPAGGTSTASIAVTIKASSLTQLYMANDADFQSKKGLITDNTEVIFARGQTFNFSSPINLTSKHDVIIRSDDLPANLPKATLNYTAAGSKSSPTVFFDTSDQFDPEDPNVVPSRNIQIRNLKFDSTVGTDDEGTAPFVSYLRGKNISVQFCDLDDVRGMGESVSEHTQGILLQRVTTTAQVAAYTLFIGGPAVGVVALGNTIGGSRHQSAIRIEGGVRYSLVYSNNVRTGSTGRSALRLMDGSLFYADHNTLYGTGNWLGPLPDSDGNEKLRTNTVIFDGNTLEGSDVRLNPGLNDAVLRNNIFKGNAAVHLRNEPGRRLKDAQGNFLTVEVAGKIEYVWQLRPDTNVVQNVWIVNNTRTDSESHKFIRFELDSRFRPDPNDSSAGGGFDPYMRFKNIHVANNLTALRLRTQAERPAIAEGVHLTALKTNHPILSQTLKWYDALVGQLQDPSEQPLTTRTRWWVAHNVWYDYPHDFVIDESGRGVEAWNRIWSKSWLPISTFSHKNPADKAVFVRVGSTISGLTQLPSRSEVGTSMPSREPARRPQSGGRATRCKSRLGITATSCVRSLASRRGR
jgi:hypothetical protein